MRHLPPPTEMSVGLDIGTSHIKLVGVDRDGTLIVGASRPTPWAHTQTGAEMEPKVLAACVGDVMSDAALKMPSGTSVTAVGFTSFGEAGVLERDGESLAPVISWYDNRSAPQAAQLDTRYGQDFARRTGLPATHVASLTKLRWMIDELGLELDGCRWYSVAEWLVEWFGGSSYSEWSLASRTGLLDVRSSTVWTGALEFLETTAERTPELLRSPGPPRRSDGRMRRGPKQFHGAALSVAGLDHLVGAECIGATQPGVLVDSCGTAEAILRFIGEHEVTDAVVERVVSAGMTVGRHTGTEGFVVIGVARTGLLLESIKDLSGGGDLDSPVGDQGVEVVVERDDSISIRRLRPGVSRGAVWSAGLRAAINESARAIAGMNDLFGTPERTVLTGGWTHNQSFMNAKSLQIVGAEHDTQTETGAIGAARRARLDSGR